MAARHGNREQGTVGTLTQRAKSGLARAARPRRDGSDLGPKYVADVSGCREVSRAGIHPGPAKVSAAVGVKEGRRDTVGVVTVWLRLMVDPLTVTTRPFGVDGVAASTLPDH